MFTLYRSRGHFEFSLTELREVLDIAEEYAEPFQQTASALQELCQQRTEELRRLREEVAGRPGLAAELAGTRERVQLLLQQVAELTIAGHSLSAEREKDAKRMGWLEKERRRLDRELRGKGKKRVSI